MLRFLRLSSGAKGSGDLERRIAKLERSRRHRLTEIVALVLAIVGATTGLRALHYTHQTSQRAERQDQRAERQDQRADLQDLRSIEAAMIGQIEGAVQDLRLSLSSLDVSFSDQRVSLILTGVREHVQSLYFVYDAIPPDARLSAFQVAAADAVNEYGSYAVTISMIPVVPENKRRFLDTITGTLVEMEGELAQTRSHQH